MPYKYGSLARRRFVFGTGVRFMADGVTVRCQAVRRSVSKKMKREGKIQSAKELWPEYQCHLAARPGYFVCRWHGAGWEGGRAPGRPPYKNMTKKATEYIRGDLADKYRTFAEDDELFNMRYNTALLSARNAQLLEDIAEASLSHPKKTKALEEALELIEGGDVIIGCAKLRSVLQAIKKGTDAWSEIRQNTTVIKDLTKAEIERSKEMRLYLNQEQVFGLIDRFTELIINAVTKEVSSPSEQSRVLSLVSGGVRDIVGSGGRALIESPNVCSTDNS